jgi:diguanylate cyclase (GGDEF)-like protein
MLIVHRLWLSKASIVVGLAMFSYLSFATDQATDVALLLRREAFQSFLNAETLMISLGNAETGQRGYLLTGKLSYLDPYTANSRTVCKILAGPGAPPAVTNLASRLAQLCRDKMAEMKETIDLRQQKSPAAALALVNTDQGKLTMDRVRSTAEAMRKILWVEVARQDQAIASDQRLQVITIVLGSLVMTAFILINGILLTRSLRRPLQAIEQRLKRVANGDLGAAVALVGDDELTTVARSLNDMTEQLRSARSNRERVQAELDTTSKNLRSQTEALESRAYALDLVGELANRLLSARDEAEFAKIVEIFAPRLFMGTRGALYSITNSRASVRQIGAWCEPLKSVAVFSPRDCWAIRRGQPHVVKSDACDIGCPHVEAGWAGSYSCLPLVAQGETVGVLYIEETGVEVGANHNLQVLNETIAASLVNLRLRDTLRDQSIRDPVTGLFNRRYLEEAFETECARAARSGHPLSALMADIDHFKRFNDTFGHDAGDMVLKQFGEIIRRILRLGDIVCRYGGEEFAMVLPGSDIAGSIALSERVRQEVAGFDFTHRGRRLGQVTVSIGVAGYDLAGRSPATIMAAADQALYAAKSGGRNRVAVFDPTSQAPAINELAI